MDTTTNLIPEINETSNLYTEEQINAAKYLVWSKMDDNDKRMLVHVATSNQLAQLNKEIKSIGLVYSYSPIQPLNI